MLENYVIWNNSMVAWYCVIASTADQSSLQLHYFVKIYLYHIEQIPPDSGLSKKLAKQALTFSTLTNNKHCAGRALQVLKRCACVWFIACCVLLWLCLVPVTLWRHCHALFFVRYFDPWTCRYVRRTSLNYLYLCRNALQREMTWLFKAGPLRSC